MTNSKPIALDRHDIHVLLDMIGGYGVAVVAGIIATLSVCAAFFIYRSVRGQRGKARDSTATEDRSSARRRGDDCTQTESTEDQETKLKMCCRKSEARDETYLIDTSNILTTEVSEKDLNESTLKDLEELTDELLTELEPESEDKADSDLDQCTEPDLDKPDDNMELSGDECVEDICDVLAHVNVQCEQIECQRETGETIKEEPEECLRVQDKSETEFNVDTDEPSETESAQEIINEKHQACKSQDDSQSNYFSDLPHHTKTGSTVEEVNNASCKFEDPHDWRFPRTKDFDCIYNDKKTDLVGNNKSQAWFHCGDTDVETPNKHQNNSSKFDCPTEPPQNYLGFHSDNSFIAGSSTCESVEKKNDKEGAAVEKKNEKNEISIMEAIMDNNEWLNVGGPEYKDLPWLTTQTATINAKHTNEGQEETIVTVTAKEEEPANKKVATVQPLPQLVDVTFRLHYITHSPNQLVAVTGNLQELGAWEGFVPLHGAKDGFWANTITLPTENQVEWKFVVVDDGKISRWEECGNRNLVLSSADEQLYLNKLWGYI